jgi:hypothetical protein
VRAGWVNDGRLLLRLGDGAVGVDAHRKYSAAASALHAQARVRVGFDFLAFGGKAPEQPNRITADRLEIFGRNLGPQPRVHVFDVRAGIDDGFACGNFANRFLLVFVVLVANFTDDFLE